MKIFLIILYALLFLLLCVFLTKVSFRIKASSDVSMTMEILFLRFPIFPKKESRPNARRFTKKGLERQILKERKKADKQKRKKADKAAKKDAKKQAAPKKGAEKKQKMSVIEIIELVTLLVRKLLNHLSRRLKIDVKRLNVTVATGDAASTAILYGAVSAAAAGLTELLCTAAKTKLPDEKNGGVYADFTGDKTTVDIELVLSMRVYNAFITLVSLAYHYLKKQFFGNMKG